MLEQLKKEVYEANMELQEKGLVIYTWGNVSGIDRENNLVVIKPSGVDYAELSPEDMVVVDFNQNVVEGRYRPSSDTATHIELYRAYDNLAGVVHTHSTWAVTFAQAGMAIPAYVTTHADYFYGSRNLYFRDSALHIEGLGFDLCDYIFPRVVGNGLGNGDYSVVFIAGRPAGS